MSAVLSLEQVDLAIDHFELHVHQCNLCLVQGNRLCTEGRFIAEDVATLQAEIRRPMRRPSRGLDVLRRRSAPSRAGV
ncbi:MAG: hypothetical protein L3K06_02110 [Thermoplasmata archaeon]|nr:hypothetical protein [Thermoplasmata archaeon]MCI4354142.1 hypothetical protein [Thermoplasmata archaeon]